MYIGHISLCAYSVEYMIRYIFLIYLAALFHNLTCLKQSVFCFHPSAGPPRFIFAVIDLVLNCGTEDNSSSRTIQGVE